MDSDYVDDVEFFDTWIQANDQLLLPLYEAACRAVEKTYVGTNVPTQRTFNEYCEWVFFGFIQGPEE